MHHKALWSDGKIEKRRQPQIARNTGDRTKIGLGHIGFEWTAATLPRLLACDPEKRLEVQQK
jgi:hypothetical protein